MFCYVILHYLTAKDTINCVESILKQNEECKIIMVDNASNNGSIEQIEERYKKNTSIIIIKNEKNLGFAAGNNIGYIYARTECKADFIAVSNNDIVIDTPNFIKSVRSAYSKEQFHVAGPDIVSMIDNQHQNPMIDSLATSEKAIRRLIRRYKFLLFISKTGLYDIIKRKTNDSFKGKSNNKLNNNGHKQLHGAFMIFSPLYVKEEEYAFRPGTFLYMEESILYRYCQNKGYTMKYIPELLVYHKEDSSTNVLCGATKKKREFVFKNMIRSLKVYASISWHDNKESE